MPTTGRVILSPAGVCNVQQSLVEQHSHEDGERNHREADRNDDDHLAEVLGHLKRPHQTAFNEPTLTVETGLVRISHIKIVPRHKRLTRQHGIRSRKAAAAAHEVTPGSFATARGLRVAAPPDVNCRAPLKFKTLPRGRGNKL
jgi:hypothetical protein